MRGHAAATTVAWLRSLRNLASIAWFTAGAASLTGREGVASLHDGRLLIAFAGEVDRTAASPGSGLVKRSILRRNSARSLTMANNTNVVQIPPTSVQVLTSAIPENK